ncbi:hypothetical protein QUC31_007653 [Theobroma cacao]
MDGIKREGSGNGSLEREDGKDLVDVLLEIQKDMSDLTLGRDSIKAVVLDTFAAGTDTTNTVLEWAMTELLRHPKIVKELQKQIKESSSSALPVNLTEIFAMLTNNVICRAALGRKYSEGEGGKKFKKLLCEFVELLGGFNVGDYIPWLAWVSRINGLEAKMEKVAKEFDAFLEGVVDEHMDRYKRGHNDHDDTRLQHEEQKSFVDVLLEIQRENTVGFPLERVSVKALILCGADAVKVTKPKIDPQGKRNRIGEYSYPSTVNLSKVLGLYANDVLCRVAFGRDFSQGGDYDRHGFQKMLEDYQELLGGFSTGDFFPSMEFIHNLTGMKSRLQDTFRRFDQFFDEVINEHLNPKRQKEERSKDLVEVLLDVQKNVSNEIPLTMDNVKAIILVRDRTFYLLKFTNVMKSTVVDR